MKNDTTLAKPRIYRMAAGYWRYETPRFVIDGFASIPELIRWLRSEPSRSFL